MANLDADAPYDWRDHRATRIDLEVVTIIVIAATVAFLLAL